MNHDDLIKTEAVIHAPTSARIVEEYEREKGEAQVAKALSTAWWKAQGGLLEILRFGAMLSEVKGMIKSSPVEKIHQQDDVDSFAFSNGKRKRGGHNKGTGIKEWLERNCPEINYNTANGYMTAAEGLRNLARLAADVPLLAMMGEDPIPEAQAEMVRQRVMDIIAKAGVGLLKDAGRQGRPRGGTSEGRRALTALERSEAAKDTLRGLVSSLGALITSGQAGMIPMEYRRAAATALKDYAAKLADMK